jgi:hypothetical protein
VSLSRAGAKQHDRAGGGEDGKAPSPLLPTPHHATVSVRTHVHTHTLLAFHSRYNMK